MNTSHTCVRLYGRSMIISERHLFELFLCFSCLGERKDLRKQLYLYWRSLNIILRTKRPCGKFVNWANHFPIHDPNNLPVVIYPPAFIAGTYGNETHNVFTHTTKVGTS